jgi:hypothetical protein
MRIPSALLACALVAGAAVSAHAQRLPAALSDAQIANVCKKISFKRHPPGQMSTAMREAKIELCIRNKGWLE